MDDAEKRGLYGALAILSMGPALAAIGLVVFAAGGTGMAIVIVLAALQFLATFSVFFWALGKRRELPSKAPELPGYPPHTAPGSKPGRLPKDDPDPWKD